MYMVDTLILIYCSLYALFSINIYHLLTGQAIIAESRQKLLQLAASLMNWWPPKIISCISRWKCFI